MRSDVTPFIRKGFFQVSIFFRAIHQIAKLFKELGIPEPYSYMLTQFKKIDITEADLFKADSFEMTLMTYWTSTRSRVAVAEIFLDTLDKIRENFVKFAELFGCKSIEEFLMCIQSEEMFARGLIHFASHIEINDFFYTTILPSILNKKVFEKLAESAKKQMEADIERLEAQAATDKAKAAELKVKRQLLKGIGESIGNFKMVDMKKVFKRLVSEGKLIVTDGFVRVRANAQAE